MVERGENASSSAANLYRRPANSIKDIFRNDTFFCEVSIRALVVRLTSGSDKEISSSSMIFEKGEN